MYNKMNILVLGGNGYLGSKVTHKLVERGYSVVCTKREKSNLARLTDIEKEIRFIPATETAVRTAFENKEFEWVLNLVCNYGKDTVLYETVIESNILFPLTVLNIATQNLTKNFLTIGTGLPDDLNMYSFTKSKFSDFGRFYSEKHNVNFINMKLEMFYGADEPKDRFIPSCIYKMLNDEDVKLTKGTQRRDIVSIYDVVEAIMFVIDYGLKGFHELPVGTGEAPEIRDLMGYIKDVTNSNSNLKFGAIPMRNGEQDCIADSQIMTNMGFEYRYPWKKGIADMVEHIKKKTY